MKTSFDLATLQLLCKNCGLDFSAEYCIDLLSGVTSSLLSCNLATLGPRGRSNNPTRYQPSTVHIHETEKDMGKKGKERNEAEIKAKMRGESLDQSRGWRGRLALTEASLWCPLGNIAATWQTVIIITPQHDNCCVRGHCYTDCYTLLHPILVWCLVVCSAVVWCPLVTGHHQLHCQEMINDQWSVSLM